MKVVITGGAGFLGLRLARRLLEMGHLTAPSGASEPIDELVLFDVSEPRESISSGGVAVRTIAGDISERDTVFSLIDRDDISVFHLASVVSGGGEKDFDLAMRVNLDGGRHLLEAVRAREGVPRFVFASSLAVFGGAAMPAAVGDTTKHTPQTTYGITKAILELLINDYTRKGYLDGRSARLPTVIVRPGKPNAAASSFVSGVIREPLNGVDFTLPVPETTSVAVLGYRAIVDGLIHLHELGGIRLGDDRAVGLPSLTVTVSEMIEALRRVAGSRRLGSITVEPDPFVGNVVDTWPAVCMSERAGHLGFPNERNLDEIIRYYIEDYLQE